MPSRTRSLTAPGRATRSRFPSITDRASAGMSAPTSPTSPRPPPASYQTSPLVPVQQLLEAHDPDLLQSSCPSHPPLPLSPGARSTSRSLHALSKPDRSHASYTQGARRGAAGVADASSCPVYVAHGLAASVVVAVWAARQRGPHPLRRRSGSRRAVLGIGRRWCEVGDTVRPPEGSCPLAWCSWRDQRALRHGRADQSAKGRPMMGSSATGAMVSRVM
jgi:hypothetical protein